MTGLKRHLLLCKQTRPIARNAVLRGLGDGGTEMAKRRAHGSRLMNDHAQESLMSEGERPART